MTQDLTSSSFCRQLRFEWIQYRNYILKPIKYLASGSWLVCARCWSFTGITLDIFIKIVIDHSGWKVELILLILVIKRHQKGFIIFVCIFESQCRQKIRINLHFHISYPWFNPMHSMYLVMKNDVKVLAIH